MIFTEDFYLGFREATKINLMFKEVIKDMMKKGEVDITSRYESLVKTILLEISSLFFQKNSCQTIVM